MLRKPQQEAKDPLGGGHGLSWRRLKTLLEEVKDPLGGGQGTSILAEPS